MRRFLHEYHASLSETDLELWWMYRASRDEKITQVYSIYRLDLLRLLNQGRLAALAGTDIANVVAEYLIPFNTATVPIAVY